MTYQEFLSDLFAEWSNDDLAEFIYDAREYASDRQTGRTLTHATEIAGKLAEAELDTREQFQRQIQQEIWADLDAMRASQREAVEQAADDQRHWGESSSAGVCPF